MKTKHAVAMLAGLVLPILSGAQQIIYSQCLGTEESEHANDFLATSDGGYIIVGYTKTPSEMTSETNHGGKDVLVTRLNAEGTLLWQKNYGGSGNDEAFGVTETPTHDFMVVATSYSNDIDVTDHIGDTDSSDIWLLSLNPFGQIIWTKSFGTTGNESAVDISLSNANRILIAGNFELLAGESTQFDYWLAQLDFNGNVYWDHLYGGNNDDFLQKMLWTSNDDVYLGGSSYSFGDNNFDGETYVVKIDQYGDVTWELSFGSSSSYGTGSVSDMCVSEDEVITISRVSALEPDEFSCNAHGSFQYAQITTEGEVIQHWCYGGNDTDKSQSACTDGDGNYWLMGTTNSESGDVPSPNGYVDNETNVWLCKTDEEGSILWKTSIGGSLTEEAVAMVIDANGRIVLLANTNSSNGETNGQHSVEGNAYDVWLVKIDPLASYIADADLATNMDLYPCPAQNKLNFSNQHTLDNTTYRITDTQGKLIESGKIGIGQSELDISQIHPGVYAFTLSDSRAGMIRSGRFVKQ